MTETRQKLTALRRRRGIIRSSITRLDKRIRELEDISDQPTTAAHARELAVKVETLGVDFKTYHLEIIDLMEEDEEALEREQEILDDHDDHITDLSVRIKRLCTTDTPHSTKDPDPVKLASRRLSRLERIICSMHDTITDLPSTDGDLSLVEQYEVQIASHRSELSEAHTTLLIVDDESEVEEQLTLHTRLEEILFQCSHLLRRLARSYKGSATAEAPSSMADGSGVRLPKLSVPTFDGNILNWRQFWDQFCVSIHNRHNLTDAEKLVYLQHALKDGSAKPIIEGLSQSGEQYGEAIKCLTARFDRPRLIHQTHVKMIIDAPSVRDGSGKELRRLHDIAQQHIRALKSLGEEPSPAFITSVLELKLDSNTMFEWQRHSQSQTEVPHYQEILEFLDYRAQASEISAPIKQISKANLHVRNNTRSSNHTRNVSSYATSCEPHNSHCIVCKAEKHPLYSCPKFKTLSHDKKIGIVRGHNLCMNCLGKDHFIAQCKSLHRCRKCQGQHHTLLHKDQGERPNQSTNSRPIPQSTNELEVSVNTITTKLRCNPLLMTCQLLVETSNGSSMKVRALLDSGSSVSFISERVAQTLNLRRTKQTISVFGVGGASPNMKIESVASFKVSSTSGLGRTLEVMALVVPRVVRNLPSAHMPFDKEWTHIQDLRLADPEFNVPGRVDVLLGIDVYNEVILNGRRKGSFGAPTAIETLFGWVLCGNVESSIARSPIATTCHTSIEISDNILQRFWEVEEPPTNSYAHYNQEERIVLKHFKESHTRDKDGRFIVPLPKSTDKLILGESRSQAVRRFLSLERNLNNKNQFTELDNVIKEYFDLSHAELVPPEDLEKPTSKIFYLPIHAVYKNTSTTTKVRAVFDASAKSTSNVSLNDTLLKGPNVHPPLVDVLLRFRTHCVAITADVSKMYRAVKLAPEDKDYHRFVWRSSSVEPLKDYRMTRVTFGVCASSFAANMSLKQNAIDYEHDFPLASKTVEESVYVDDCLTGAKDIEGAISLYKQLLELFNRGGFLLRKWNSSEPLVLESIDSKLRDSIDVLNISGSKEYAKTLGLEWNTTLDHFRLTITTLPSPEGLTKRMLVSNVAKLFDVLGWLSPTIIKMKILLQRLWETKLEWDDLVPLPIKEIWLRWRDELPLLSSCFVPRYFFPKDVTIVKTQLHGFADASESAYGAVVYIRGEDTDGNFHIGLVLAKTKVSPLKRLTIPRLELCGAHLLAQLLDHVRAIYRIPITDVYAWTDSTVVLNWLVGSPRRFKVFVGNRVSAIIDSISPNCWHHVSSADNPADCSSRGIYPSDLVDHQLWWNGPTWLKYPRCQWPEQSLLSPNDSSIDKGELCLTTTVHTLFPKEPVIPLNRYSTFIRYQRITAWIFRFVNNCQGPKRSVIKDPCLSVKELLHAERYWLMISQHHCFFQELIALHNHSNLNCKGILKTLNPFIDVDGLMRVGGRISNSGLSYTNIHPIILHSRHVITKLLIHCEHRRLLHAGPNLLCSSIGLRFHIIGLRRIARSITRGCITCRRLSGKPLAQLQGQLPSERVVPGSVFEKTGVDYAGPFNIKYGSVRKPTVVKAYVAVFVSLAVKAVHFEIVSDLTTQAFIAALRRFTARRGHPTLIWSDNGTNFVGANNELKSLFQFLKDQQTNKSITEFCSIKKIEWRFIPERSPHFGGLWEAAVKSMKVHMKRVLSADVRLTYEELSTVLCQIEACLNSRPLAPLSNNDEESIDALTPGHFLIGKSLVAIPDDSNTEQSLSLLRRWYLCQSLVRHFWNRWSKEYVTTLNKYGKWYSQSRNAAVGDIVVLRDETLFPTKWPLARVIEVHPGKDSLVRVVTIKTEKGIYKRPITKIVVLLPIEKEQ